MKKICFSVVLALSMLCTLIFTPQTLLADEANVTVDLLDSHQTIDGFGASYTWYSCWLPSNIHAEQGYDWIFNDAEFNILRFRDQHEVVGEGERREALEGYKAYKAYYDAAVARGIDPLVLVTSWGQYRRDLPFVAFTELDSSGHTYYTLAKNADGEYMYDELAQFCVESIQLFFDAGIPVHYFSISNETELQGLGKDEQGNARNEAGFFFGNQEDEYHCAYWKAHVAIYNAFQEAFGENAPKITGAEVMADDGSTIHRYLNPLQIAAPDSFDLVAHHLYGSANTPRSFKDVSDRFSQKFKLWQTEYYLNDYIKQAEMMANEFIYENVNAYLYWNGVWIEDDGNCLIEIAGYDSSQEIYRRGNHYIMMHFSKYVKRGYQRVEVTNDSASTVVAFKAPDHSKLVIIAVNRTDAEDSLTFDLGVAKVKDSAAYRTIGAENRDDFQYWLDAGKFSEDTNVLPPMSVTTYVLDIDAPAPEVIEEPDDGGDTTETVDSSAVSDSVNTPEASDSANGSDTQDVHGESSSLEHSNTSSASWPKFLVFFVAAIALVIAAVMGRRAGEKK